MAGHSRSKNGITSLAYVPAIHVLRSGEKNVDARDKPGHEVGFAISPASQGGLKKSSAAVRQISCARGPAQFPAHPPTCDAIDAAPSLFARLRPLYIYGLIAIER